MPNRQQITAAAILLAATLLAGCNDANKVSDAHAKGAADAQADLDNGILKLKEYPPLPAPGYHGEYINLLRERCNCDYEVVPMRGYSKETHDEVNGYNGIMTAELNSRFGAGILAELQAEAMKRWEERSKGRPPVEIKAP